MNRVLEILNRRWAVLLALLPLFNVLYIVLFFMIANRRAISLIKAFLAGAIVSVLFQILPESMGWLVTCLIISTVSGTLILCGRGNYKTNISMKRLQKPLFAVGMFVVCIAVLCAVLPKDDERYVRDQMDVAVDALASGNSDAWQATIHPKYGSHLMNLQVYLADLEQDGIIIAPDCYVDGRINVADISVDDGHIIKIERKLRTGEETYIIKAEYQFGEEAEGFVLFEIKPFRQGPAPYS